MCVGTADPARGAGNDGDLAIQLAHDPLLSGALSNGGAEPTHTFTPDERRTLAPAVIDVDLCYRIPIMRVKRRDGSPGSHGPEQQLRPKEQQPWGWRGYGPAGYGLVMRARRLGTHGPELSVIGFGAMEVGNREEASKRGLSDEDVLNVIRAAPDAGINWIDTAESYGAGHSETLLGRALSGRRDEVHIATKVAEQAASYGGTGFRPEEIRAACDASLERLRTDRIDLYQLHWFPRDGEQVPIEETWGAMAGLVEQGKVRFIGVSNFNQREIERCLAVRHVDSLQAQFSPVTPAQTDLIKWCGDRGIGVLAYGPIGYGLIRSPIMIEEEMTQMLGELLGPEAPERWGFAALQLVREMQPFAERLGMSLSHLALAWNLAQPGVTSVIVGSMDPDHVRSNAEAGDVRLDGETVKAIDALVDRYRASDARPLDQFGLGRGLEELVDG